MKYLISAILLAMSLAPLAAHADVAPQPGTHTYDRCILVDNVASFSDYDIYVRGTTRFPYVNLARGPQDSQDCSGGDQSVFAVKKTDEAKIVHNQDPEVGDSWFTLDANQKYIISSIVSGSPDISTINFGTLPDSNPTAHFVDIYHITSLTNAPSGLKVSFVSDSQYDANWKLVSGPAIPYSSTLTPTTPPTLPAPFNHLDSSGKLQLVSPNAPAASTVTSPLTLMWLVIVCMGAVILALVVKTWKK